MSTFTINKKEYKAKAFTFNLICDLEDAGISLQEAGKKQFLATRAYFAACAGLNSEQAGAELESHIISGGTLDEIGKAMAAEMEKSDFFRSLSQRATEETGTDETKETPITV